MQPQNLEIELEIIAGDSENLNQSKDLDFILSEATCYVYTVNVPPKLKTLVSSNLKSENVH